MLTPGDVKRWDLGAIQMVFETASGRAATLQRLGDGLDQAHRVLAEWQGEAGEAFRADVGRIRRDIEADGVESQRVAAAVSRAEADVSACKRELEDVERAAAVNGWTITSDWRIEVGDAWIGRDPIGLAAEQQVLQDELTACKVHAHAADHELATAIGAAVGEVSLDGVGVSPGGVVPRQGVPDVSGGRPRTWQEMLLPGGPAEAGPGGVPAEGPLVSAGGGGEPPSLRDLLLPTERTQPTGAGGQEPAPGSVPDLLSRVHQPVVSGVRPPRPSAAEVERFKALVRPTMIADGVAPGQVEARLNEIVARAQRWIDEGMPNYVAPEPPRPPAPGFGEGFGDRWRATEQGIKNLFGQGGPGAPGVLESWQRMLEGTVETVQNPIGSAIGEVKDALDSPSPAYFLGAKVSDAATTLPGLFFGGEGAAIRAGLSDIGPGVLDTGPVVSPHAPIGFDHPPTYNPWADQAAFDLNYAHTHGGPTPGLSRQLADMSTHYVGDNPDRVVLGRFDGQDGGYIGEARGHGGIYYDTGRDAWDAIGHGLGSADADALGWQVNEQFLRGQMENGVSRIEYVLNDQYPSLEAVVLKFPDSFSAKEIEFLVENAPKYGYRRVGNAWVRD
ncbi:WXG100 family type VII secretion target [Mycobacterium riyadhense]|uniref:WXG100 family type VII secretion target n=1 Tax=Mycobacterium riyadhense TaxID=486698 RepID=UPI002012D07D|nr:hypothetical protein [Mycobacterium riyadhense]